MHNADGSVRPRIFYGWWVVMISALGLFLGPIPIVVFSFGVFLQPLTPEFHSGRGAVSLALTLHNSILALGLPFAGRLVDRYGARKVIVPATFLAGLVLLSASFCSGKLWQLYAFYMALGVSGWGVGPVPYGSVISHWFDRHRGLALGFTMAGLGLGASLIPSLGHSLITRFGWRLAFGVAGSTMLAITLPTIAAFLKDRPEPMGLLPDGVSHANAKSARSTLDSGLTWREAWHDSTFWLLFCAFILVSASVQSCFAHISAILADRGTPAAIAALATSLFGGGVLVGRAGSGYLLDRFFAPRIASGIFGCASVGIALLRISGSQQLSLAAAFLIGLGLGAEVDIMSFLTSRYFGLRSFGLIYGVAFAGFGLSGGLGALLMGSSFDANGSYALMLNLFCIATAVGATLMLGLGPYRFQIGTPSQSVATQERAAVRAINFPMIH